MAGGRTHYEVLGVTRDASSVDIASAFRDKLADLKAKPGILPQAIDALREAYQTLANPGRRDAYDATLPPPPGARRARASATAVADEPSAGWMSSTAFKLGVPIVIVALVAWGWASRKKPAEPAARIVSSQVVLPAPSPGAAPDFPEPSRGASAQPTAAASPAPSRSAEQVFTEVSPSVVRVHVADANGRSIGQGSGVVTGPGRVITNCHVTSGASKVTVKSGADIRTATVSIADEEFDLCSLEVPGLDAPAVSIGSVGGLRTGQRVYAVGAPMGLELTISEGIVSSLREMSGSRLIQTTAAVSPGSSGGGLFGGDGQLVGIVTFQHRYGQNLNFAVPADWIGDMRTRASTAASTVASRDLSVEEMVVGKWWCFGSLSGRNGEYTYESGGRLVIVSPDRPTIAGPYRVSGRRILYQARDGAFAFDIESITRERMVQHVGDGQRLACERRG